MKAPVPTDLSRVVSQMLFHVINVFAARRNGFILSFYLVLASILPLQASVKTRYATELSALRDQAESAAHIRYRDILEIAYHRPDLEKWIDYKKQWQRSTNDSCIYLSDYQRIDRRTKFATVAPLRNESLGSTVIGRYEPRIQRIALAEVASDQTLAHEAGHALQQDELVKRRILHSPDIRYSELEYKIRSLFFRGGLSIRSLKRLKYLAAQDELEVRLQDLNRFFAAVNSGRPILTPLEALTALAQIDVPIDTDTAARALAGTAWQRSRTQLDTLIANAKRIEVNNRTKRFFEDARELRLLYTSASEFDADLSDRVLKKIIFEAPGHI